MTYPPPSYPPPPYPPPPPNMYGSPPPAPVVPGTVKAAFGIYLIAALLALVGIVLALTSSVFKDAIDTGGVTTSGVSVATAVNIAKISTVVAGVIFLGLYLLFAFKMRAGRNWARVVLTVLSALSILSSFSASASVTVNGHIYKSSSTQISGVIGAILGVVAIVLMYLAASNAYFSASKAARQQFR